MALAELKFPVSLPQPPATRSSRDYSLHPVHVQGYVLHLFYLIFVLPFGILREVISFYAVTYNAVRYQDTAQIPLRNEKKIQMLRLSQFFAV